jgi:rhodanese-related sulfurtransferase
MLLLTEGQSRLAITFGSMFLGLLLVIIAYFNGNNVAVKPDYRKHRAFVYERRIGYSELYDSMVTGNRNFSVIGFRTPKECIQQLRFSRFLKCFDKEKLQDMKWIRNHFPNLKSPLVIFGTNKKDSFNFAVKMRYYGFNSRMLDGGIEEYLYDFLGFPIPFLKNIPLTYVNEKLNTSGLTQIEKEKRQLFYMYLVGEIETFQKIPKRNVEENTEKKITGVVQFISRKNHIFEVKNYLNNEMEILPFDKNTQFINAKAHYEFQQGDLVDIWISKNKKALQIKRNIIKLPLKNIIKTKKLERTIRKKEEFILIDIRNKEVYEQSHLPYAINIENYKLEMMIKALNISQNTLLIIYGDGPTQPVIKSAFEILQKLEFKNIEVYTAGITEWKKQKRILVIDNDRLIKHHSDYLILDVRPQYLSQISIIEKAVAIESFDIVQKEFFYKKNKTPKKNKKLRNLIDKSYPIVLYDSKLVELKSIDIKSNFFQPDVHDVYEVLLNWGYYNIVVLEGGFYGWRQNYPVTEGINKNEIQLSKRKKQPGAINLDEFKHQIKNKAVVLIDVRTFNETKKGKVKNAIHIPLQIIKNKSQTLERSKSYIIYCANGMRAKSAYLMLTQMGFNNVAYLNSNFQ